MADVSCDGEGVVEELSRFGESPLLSGDVPERVERRRLALSPSRVSGDGHRIVKTRLSIVWLSPVEKRPTEGLEPLRLAEAVSDVAHRTDGVLQR